MLSACRYRLSALLSFGLILYGAPAMSLTSTITISVYCYLLTYLLIIIITSIFIAITVITNTSLYTQQTFHTEIKFLLGMCGKPKFHSDSGFKNRTVQNFDIR